MTTLTSAGRNIISVLDPKGGCGKTTISTYLARALHDRGHSVLIVGADPQGSTRNWLASNVDNSIELVTLDHPSNGNTLVMSVSK